MPPPATGSVSQPTTVMPDHTQLPETNGSLSANGHTTLIDDEG